jgi:hypothetical protein
MAILSAVVLFVAMVAILDGVFFFMKRENIEPNVHARFPSLNCGRLATLEIAGGVLIILATISNFLL